MLKVSLLDSSDPLSVVEHLVFLIVEVARPDKSVKHDIAIEVDNGNLGKPLAFVSQNSFAVQS